MPSDIFRHEAIEHYKQPPTEAAILLMVPGWTRWTYRLLLGLLAGALVFVWFASVSRYVEGPAVIRADERIAVTAAVSGVVASVPVVPGNRVAQGDVLVQFRSVDEEAQIAAAQREFDSALVRMLANPMDQYARQALAAPRAQRDLLATRLSERCVRAAEAGVVGDVRVRPGQSVAPGELVVSLARDRARFSVLALLPGEQRPSLQKGLPLRLEISGYPYAYQNVTIDGMDDEIVGPYEIRRILGPQIADSVSVLGPVVVVHATLQGATFEAGREAYRYFDGMPAKAQVRLRSERLVTILAPGLTSFSRRGE